MGILDDFLQLPNGLKLLLGFALILGASIDIPFIGFSIGQVIFFPFTAMFSFFGIIVTWEGFVVLYGVILLLYFAHWVMNFLPNKG